MMDSYGNESQEVSVQEDAPLIAKGVKPSNKKFKVYPQRWLALGVFSSHEMVNNMMWITFGPISSIASCYYGRSLFWINALVWVSMVNYMILFLPAVWFLEKFGLRMTGIVGGCLITIGAWLRFAGSGYNGYWLLLAGQITLSLQYILETNACSKLSAVWFPPNERTLATTVFAIVSAQLGMLIGLLATPLSITGGPDTNTVCNSTLSLTGENERYEWLSTTSDQFLYYLLAQAVLASLTLPFAFLLPEAPPTPPSSSREYEETVKLSFLDSAKLVFKNGYFILFVFVFAAFLAAGDSFVSVFQEVLHSSGYSKYQDVIGYLGASIVVISVVGLLLTSRWIDYSKKYYCTSVFVCFLAAMFTITLTLLIRFKQTFYAIFIAASLTGGSHSLLGAVGLEYVVEMTYPLSEGVSASVLYVAVMSMGTFMIIAVGLLVQYRHTVYGMYLLSGMLLLAAVTMLFIRPPLKRRQLEATDNKNTAIQ